MLPKPSRLARTVDKWESRQAKRAQKLKAQKAAIAAWRVTCALVKSRDGGLCRVCGEPTKTTGHPAMLAHCHHIVFRSYKRDDSLENLVHVHAKCHEAIHGHLVTLRGTASHLLVEDNR